MSIKKVLNYKDMSKKKSDLIEDILSEDTQTLIDTLIESCIAAGGYGLGAPQIGIDKQLFVYRKNIRGDKKSYKVIINPKIIVSSGKLKSKEEGCLSIEGERRTIIRSKTFILKCYNRDGKEVRVKGNTKKETIILQHEYDHIIGKLIIDY